MMPRQTGWTIAILLVLACHGCSKPPQASATNKTTASTGTPPGKRTKAASAPLDAKLAKLAREFDQALAAGNLHSPPGRSAIDYHAQVCALDPGQPSKRLRRRMVAAIDKAIATATSPPTRCLIDIRSIRRINEGVRGHLRSVPKGKDPTESSKKRAQAMIAEGERLLRTAGTPDAALRKFKEAQRANNRSVAALVGIARASYEKRLNFDAVIAARAALELDRRDVSAWIVLGDASRWLGCPKKAQEAWREAFRLQPSNIHAKKRVLGPTWKRTEQ